MSTPKSIYHGLSVLSDADASQRLAHPLAATVDIEGVRFPRLISNFFNDVRTASSYQDPDRFVHRAGHPGIDYLCGNGNKVKAMYGGVVTEIHDSSPLTTRPPIEYKNVTVRSYSSESIRLGFDIRYGHLSHIDGAIEIGVPVKKGQVIGLSGNTGTQVSHLHVDFKAFDAHGRVTSEDCPEETLLIQSGLPSEIAPVAQRIAGFMNFACFLPADVAGLPTITHDLLNDSNGKLLSGRTYLPFAPVFTTRPGTHDGDVPINHPLYIPSNEIGCYIIMGTAQINGYTFYEIQWTDTQRVWVPGERKLRSRGKDIVVVHIENASIPPLPARSVVRTAQADIGVYAAPARNSRLVGELPTTGPYIIRGTYLDPYEQRSGDAVVDLARRRWWQIDFQGQVGWVRSDTVNECGPTSRMARTWPSAPEGMRVIRQDSGVTVSWVPGPGLATAPEHLRATGYQVWRAENRPGNVTRVSYVSATEGDATGRISVADRPGGTAQRILYYRVAALQGRTLGPSTDWVPEVFQMVLSAVPEVSITLQPIQGPVRPGPGRAGTVAGFRFGLGAFGVVAVGYFHDEVGNSHREEWVQLLQRQLDRQFRGWVPLAALDGTQTNWMGEAQDLYAVPLLRVTSPQAVPLRTGPSFQHGELATHLTNSGAWYEVTGQNDGWWQLRVDGGGTGGVRRPGATARGLGWLRCGCGRCRRGLWPVPQPGGELGRSMGGIQGGGWAHGDGRLWERALAGAVPGGPADGSAGAAGGLPAPAQPGHSGDGHARA